MGAGSNAPRCLISAGSRPSDKGWGEGGWGSGHPDPEIRWGPGLQTNFVGLSGLRLV